MSGYDAVVVGSGPNGLAAAITLARAGRSVLVLEARETVGGGCRSAELTLPGHLHDVCSAVHPLAAASPFFRSLPLADLGVELVQPSAALAHPLDDGTAVTLERSVDRTADGLGTDAAAYRRLMAPLVRDAERDPGLGARAARCGRRGTRSRWRGSPRAPCARPPAWRAASPAIARRRSSRACRPTRSCPWRRPSRVGSGWCSACSATRWAGRSCAAAPSGWPTAWRRTCGPSAARSSPATW